MEPPRKITRHPDSRNARSPYRVPRANANFADSTRLEEMLPDRWATQHPEAVLTIASKSPAPRQRRNTTDVDAAEHSPRDAPVLTPFAYGAAGHLLRREVFKTPRALPGEGRGNLVTVLLTTRRGGGNLVSSRRQGQEELARLGQDANA